MVEYVEDIDIEDRIFWKEEDGCLESGVVTNITNSFFRVVRDDDSSICWIKAEELVSQEEFEESQENPDSDGYR